MSSENEESKELPGDKEMGEETDKPVLGEKITYKQHQNRIAVDTNSLKEFFRSKDDM